MATTAIIGIGPALSDPTDIFNSAAPLVGDAPPKATPTMAGDSSVSANGGLEYSYPIDVPPGRNGMQPHLALQYSSQSPIYGGFAAGWSLDVPIITRDTRSSVLRATSYSPYPKSYRSTLGGAQDLAGAAEASAPGSSAFRGRHDASFTRYQLMTTGSGFAWRAYTTDGLIHTFGETDHTSNCTNINDEYAPLTSSRDAFGNIVDYRYSAGVDGECRINSISWGGNASMGSFASVQIFYTPSPPVCGGVPVGSQESFKTGTKRVSGAGQVANLTITANAPGMPTSVEHERLITFGYSTETSGCAATHAPFRSLSSIQESAWGSDSPRVDLPAVTFTYGSASLVYSSPASSSPPWFDPPNLDPNNSLNLGWGIRQQGDQPTVEALMIDIDGDGLVDRLANEPLPSVSQMGTCGASWQRNLGNGSFGPRQHIAMPTLKWQTNETDPLGPFHGGPYADAAQGVNAPGHERCALNYQQTNYANSHVGGFQCPPGTGNTCPNGVYCSNGTDCLAKPGSMANTSLAFRWMDIDGDGLVDLVASPSKANMARYNLEWGNASGAPMEPLLFGVFPPCPTSEVLDPNGTYTMCGGMYPWFVYRNHGHGVFGVPNGAMPLPDKILYQPIPLEPTAADASLDWSPVGQTEGVLDIDGDGYPDTVFINSPTSWGVYLNDHSGQMFGNLFGGSFAVTTPQDSYLNQTLATNFGMQQPQQAQGLLDLDGDGLVDHWAENGPAGVTAFYGVSNGLAFQGPTFQSVRPGNDGVGRIDAWVGTVGKNTFFETDGIRQDMSRTLDMDGDGRVDVVHVTRSFPQPMCPVVEAEATNYNYGGIFGGSVPNPNANAAFGLAHTITVQGGFSWQVRSDMIDLDGDGIPESVDFGCDAASVGVMTIARASVGTSPPRLLTAIDNGRGAVSQVQYASMANGTVVEQHPESNHTMPHTRWVVQAITTTDTFAATTTTTSYHYISPEFLVDELGSYDLRGFDEIDTKLPSGATSVKKYGFAPDYRGELVQAYMRPAPTESATDIRTIDNTTWEARQLFGGAVTTYHPTLQEHFVCKNGQTLASCTPTAAAAYTRTTTTLSACSSTMSGGTCDSSTTLGPNALLWTETKSLLQSGTAAANGDRSTDATFAVWADGTTYRVRPLRTTKSVQTGGAFSVVERSGHDWNADPATAYSVPVTDLVWFDNTSPTCTTTTSSCSVTKHVYDMTTGNPIERWKPNQNSAATTKLTMTYDTRKLFAVVQVDEKGQERDYTFEYGTGTQLIVAGPNVRTCTTSCPTDSLHPLKETRKTRVDGLGRPIENWATIGTDGSVYTLIETGTTSYVDTISNPTAPTSMTTQTLIVTDSPTMTKTSTTLDGHGRPLRKTSYVQGSAPTDAVTTLTYRNDGTVATVVEPDPSANNATTVTYTYAADSLGRPVSIRRPDGSGVDVAYDGVTKTTTEFAGPAGGNGAKSVSKADPFGRTIEVDERIAVGPDTFASTHYTYDANDNVATIVDPEGVTTTMVHDFAKRRTLITRGGRNWKYSYDKNGNMTAEQVPGSPSPPTTDIDYTTTTAYDDLDRPTSRVIGKRGLGAADVALFGTDHETLTWDYVRGNQKGKLVFWAGYAPGNAVVASTTYDYDGLGQRWHTEDLFNAEGYANVTRAVYEYKALTGAPWMTTYWDNVPGSSNTSSSHVFYDPRGLPSKISLFRTGQPAQDLAITTRNVAGLVTNRRTTFTTGAMPFVESNWTYDKLGRVASQVVQKGPGTIQVARQDLAYIGNDDPKTMDDWLGSTNHKQLHYTYDQHHQLTNVSESAQGGVFAAQYAFGNAGRFHTAVESAAALPNSDVKQRSVLYHYDDADKERVTALTNTVDGTAYGSYTYDAAGNQIHRSYAATGESWDYVYDGMDRLRRVTKKLDNVVQGSEEYWYDGDGHRTQIVKKNAAANNTELVWFLGDTEAHYDGSGTLDHVYTHLALGMPVARVDRTSGTATELELQFHGLGNGTLAAVDQSGTINASFTYAPYGQIIEATDGGSAIGEGVLAHPRRMADKYVDQISNLAYFGARFYDPTLMAWTQGDPLHKIAPDGALGAPRKGQLYTYDMNNPLRYLDPDGRNPTKELPIGVQDLTNYSAGSSGRQTTELVTKAIDDTFHGGLGEQMIYGASKGQVKPTVQHGGTGALNVGKGVTFLLVNLHSNGRGAAVANGAGNKWDDLQTSPKALAMSNVGGSRTMISIDRIVDAVHSAGLDLKNPDDKDKLDNFLEHIIAHELGHDLGLIQLYGQSNMLMNEGTKLDTTPSEPADNSKLEDLDTDEFELMTQQLFQRSRLMQP